MLSLAEPVFSDTVCDAKSGQNCHGVRQGIYRLSNVTVLPQRVFISLTVGTRMFSRNMKRELMSSVKAEL